MHWEAILAFPKMKVGIVTREDRISGIRYLPPETEIKSPENEIFKVSRLHKARLLAFIEQLCRDSGARDPIALARQLLVLVDGAIAVALVSGEPTAADDAKQIAVCLTAAEPVSQGH